jgi:outer membrane protein assembly factor BamB
VFVPSSTGASLTAFSLADGSRLWRRTAGSYVYAAPAVWGGRVVFGSYDGLLRCVSAATGETLWTVSAGKPISGAVVAVAGVAYAGTFAHRILGIDVATGARLLDFPHGEYVPVSGSGGRLLLHGYSRLFAVEPTP